MATAVAGPPHPDAVRVDLWACLRPGDRVAVVADLRPRINLLAWLAVACTEIAVVEYQGPEPAGGERLREAVEVHLLDRGEAVGHDDGGDRAGGRVGQVQPAPQRHALGVELDVLAHHCLLPSLGRGCYHQPTDRSSRRQCSERVQGVPHGLVAEDLLWARSEEHTSELQ